jgi:hypothetical protein
MIQEPVDERRGPMPRQGVPAHDQAERRQRSRVAASRQGADARSPPVPAGTAP